LRTSIDWKLFFILLIASVFATVLVLPYTLSLSPALARVFTPVVLVAQVVQSIIEFSIAIFIGLFLAKRVGFGVPVLEGRLEGKEAGGYLKSILGISIGMGVLAVVLLILLSLLYVPVPILIQGAGTSIPLWEGFLASFYGGIGEEILFRLFLMTLLVWIFFKIKKTRDEKPTTVGIWLAIIISAVLFGLGHLPIVSTIAAVTPLMVAKAIINNGIVGIICGWLYWKKGLESAMIAHFTADIGLHVIASFVLSLFI
jgi:membrane protease YdiL (CAAX protease family)